MDIGTVYTRAIDMPSAMANIEPSAMADISEPHMLGGLHLADGLNDFDGAGLADEHHAKIAEGYRRLGRYLLDQRP